MSEFFDEVEGILHPSPDHMEPVPVHIVGTASVEQHAPDHSEWQSWTLNGTDSPMQILPLNPKREQAIIMVGPGLAGNQAGSLLFGSKAKVDNGQGGRLVSSQSVTVKGMAPVYCRPDGVNSLTVTIIDERWA